MSTTTAVMRETQIVQPGREQPRPSLDGWPLRVMLELGAVPTAPGCARAWTRQILWEWRLSSLAETAELIVSELTTNSVLASQWLDRVAIRLILASDRHQLAAFVRDFHPGAPARRHPGADDESGRGLLLVESISDRFGWYLPGDGTPGKVVWAVLYAPLAFTCHEHDKLQPGTHPLPEVT